MLGTASSPAFHDALLSLGLDLPFIQPILVLVLPQPLLSSHIIHPLPDVSLRVLLGYLLAILVRFLAALLD